MPQSELTFTLNGKPVCVQDAPTTLTLLQYLRGRGQTGSKEGCAEGDCGACTVAMVDRDAHGRTVYRSLNSCITLLPMVAGRELVTVEGLAQECDGKQTLHPVQEAMVEKYGSQCGYCTPGFVVSMFEGYYRNDLGEPWQVCEQLHGNLCRCTGYRPIREAMSEALRKKSVASTDLFQLRLRKETPPLSLLEYVTETERFWRPTTLIDLLALRAAHPDAWLIAGATEIGVYLNKRFWAFPKLISTEGVLELLAVTKTNEHWSIGGAVSLTHMQEALAGEYPDIDKMLLAFASRQIRNRATLAGNLVTASPIGDMAPVFLAHDALITLRSMSGSRTIPLIDFFVGYRKSALAPDEIVEAVLLPRKGSEKALCDSYKVSKRRELDISIAATAFRIVLDGEGVVQHARLAFGGVAAIPARAKKTEALLVGKAWTEETVENACEVLATEFSPIADARSGDAYRRRLIPSLFRKFFHGDRSESQDKLWGYEECTPWPDARESHNLKHESAHLHVTGRAVYVDDTAGAEHTLVAWPVLSPHAHAHIVKLDVEKARSMPGVALVLTASDVPGHNDVGAVRHDEPLFATNTVHFSGQLIAAIIGESYDACRKAAEAVTVEYEVLEPILGIREAIEKDSFHTAPHTITRDDATLAIEGASHMLEGELEIGGQEHFYLEAHAAWSEVGEDGELLVHSSTQHPSEVQAIVSHVLALPRHRITVVSPRMGGGFGGKETQGAQFAAVTALAARKTQKRVRWQLDRDLDMVMTGKRHPFFAKYRVGFDDNGRVRGVSVDLYSDGGWALDLSESILDRGLFHLDNCYYLPAVTFRGRVAKTNAVSHTAFRGFGGPQGMVVIEEMMDRIARATGLSPHAVRGLNLYRGEGETNTTHYGQPIDGNRIERIWSSLLETSAFEKRRASVAEFNRANAHIKRGLAITPVKFGISFTASFLNQAGALVLIYRDGTAQVNHGGTEMGQGLYTKILGIAMRELGLTAHRVRVMKTQTDKVPNTSATAASAGSDLNGAAVKHACEQLRERLMPIAAELLTKEGVSPASIVFKEARVFSSSRPDITIPFEQVVEAAYMRQVQLSATGFYRTPNIAYDKVHGRGKPFHYFAFGAAVCEVEVDAWSGMKRVRRVDILHDVGDSLNPGIDRGQIEGGFIQGMGWLTGEELRWSHKGQLLTHSASTYQIPAIGDTPPEFHVELLSDAAQHNVVHGSKAVGEPPLMLAIAVREALRDAIAAYSGSPCDVPLPSPATHEAIAWTIDLVRGGETTVRPAAK